MIKNYQIGSDIEFFVSNGKRVVNAEPYINGTKENPYRFSDNPYFAISRDNVLAEGNIPPTTDPLVFYNNIKTLRKYLKSVIPDGFNLLSIPAARLPYSELTSRSSQEFGCDPSLNCWTGKEIHPKPTGDNLRSAGFHIHVGYDNPNPQDNMFLARAMDLLIGVPSILIEPPNERKKVGYGVAGNYREQRHGMEYRTLSSFFVSAKSLINWCFKNTELAIDFVNKGLCDTIDGMGEIIQTVINTEDKMTASTLVTKFGIPMT